MPKELFNQPLIVSPNEPDDTDRVALGTPSSSGGKNITWARLKLLLGGSIPEAPIDGKTYGRKDADWAEVITGTADIATNADMDAGTNDTKAVSPLKFVYGITTRAFSALKTQAKSIQGSLNEIWDKLLLKAETHPSWDASTVPTAADIVINEVAGTLTLGTINGAPISVNNPAIYFIDVSGKATRFLITAPVVFDWSAKTEGVWWFWFDSTGAKVQQTAIPPTFGTATPLYRMYYSAVDGVVNTRAAEFHPNTQSAIEHEWKHFTFGTVWESGFQLVCNPLTSGAPAASGLNTCISLTGGTNIDDNFRYSIANNTSGAAWSQDLGTTTAANITTANGLLARVSYNDSLGWLRLLAATRFAFHFVGDVPQTIGADGTVTPVPNNYFFVTFTYCLQDDKAGEAVRIRSYVSSFSTIDAARAAQWEDLVSISPTLGDKEIRPLHRHIWERRTSYPNAVKQSVLRETLDIRKERVKSISVSSTTILSSNVALSTPLLAASNQDEYNVANTALVAGINSFPFAFSGLESFKIAFGRNLTFTSVIKAANITDLRVGKNGATPTTMTFPYTVIDTDILEFAATYDRYSDSYFTLKI